MSDYRRAWDPAGTITISDIKEIYEQASIHQPPGR